MFIGELAMPLPLVAKAKPVMKVGHEALAFMRKPSKFFKPLSMRTSVVNPRMTMTRPMLIQEAIVKHISPQRTFAFPREFPKKEHLQAIHQVEKRAIPKTAPSAIKVEAASSALAKTKATPTLDFEKLLEAGKTPDKGGYSKAGRGLTKKSYRSDSAYTKPTGSISEINRQGQNILEKILDHPDKIVSKESHPRFGEIIEIKVPEQGGVWFTSDQDFICFIEP
jgi:hypothetical protein